jgi:hypothetical protein
LERFFEKTQNIIPRLSGSAFPAKKKTGSTLRYDKFRVEDTKTAFVKGFWSLFPGLEEKNSLVAIGYNL